MNKRAVGTICILATVFACFGSSFTFADSSADVSIDVSNAGLQLTVPSAANIELNPTSSSAAFGSANITVNVATNNISGYTLTMSVPSTSLTHSSLVNTVIPTLSAASTEASFPANAWGYSIVNDNYLPILTTNSPASWMVEEPTNGTNHTMTLAAKVDGAKPAGDYVNTLTFQAVANPNSPKLTVAFDGNGADGGTMNAFSLYPGASANLPVNTFTRSGYYFNGWNEKANATGVGYGNEDSVTAPDVITTPQTKTLYAQWTQDTGQGGGGMVSRTLQAAYEEAYVYNHGAFQEGDNDKHGLYVPEKDPVTGEYTGNYFEATKASDYEGIPANDLRFAIQDISLLVGGQNVCERTTVIGSSAYVLDLRDFTSYHIIKAKNGRCWTTDNLALDPLASGVVLNENNTNATAEAITNFLNGSETALQDGWSTVAVTRSGGNSYNQPRINSSYKNSIPTPQEYSYDPIPNLPAEGKWRIGVYYNYCAASIGTYCYNEGAGVDKPNTTIDAEYDVCPYGWRMPTAGEIQSLSTYTSDYKNFRTLFRIPLSGYYYNSTAYHQGYYARYYSATYNDRDRNSINSLLVSTPAFSPPLNTNTYDSRYMRDSIRCIAK